MGFKSIKGEFNRTGLIADFISGKYVGNSARKVFGRIGGLNATGGTITTAAGKTIHTFTSSGTFEVTRGSGNVEYLVVAGGGGGGGGGAGGFRTGSGFAVSPGPYSITVGGGGAFGTTAVDGSS